MSIADREVVSTAKVAVQPEHRKELLLTIPPLLELIRNEAGCRAYRFYSEYGDENSFLLVGEWETQAAWDKHLNSNHFAVLLGSLRLLSSSPAVDFKILSHIALVEAVTKARCEPMADIPSAILIN